MLNYSAGFTSEGWFQNEMFIVLQMKLAGLTRKEIIEKIIENNLFQMRSEAGIRKRFQMVYRRSEAFDTSLAKYYVEGNRLDQKALLLYSYLKTYRFPYDFFMEVIVYNYQKNKPIIQTVEIDYFMERKESESEKVANWRPETKKRLRSSIIMFFREGGLLREMEQDTYEITPLHISTALTEYAKQHDKLLSLLSNLK